MLSFVLLSFGLGTYRWRYTAQGKLEKLNKLTFPYYLKHLGARCCVVVDALAISRKVAGSISDEVNAFFKIYLIFPAALGVY
jgi:hypothetical protein